MPIVLNGSGPITGVTSLNTTVSDTEIGYLDGVTSALQTQINTAGGLVKIVDSTFSAQSTVSVNNCFTSTYNNYLLTFDIVASTTAGILLRGRAAGADDSTSNYQLQLLAASSTTVTGTRSANGTSAEIFVGRTIRIITSVFFGGPNLAAVKSLSTVHQDFVSANIAEPTVNVRGCGINVTTQYDGFTVYPASGNITGTVRVYGIRN